MQFRQDRWWEKVHVDVGKQGDAGRAVAEGERASGPVDVVTALPPRRSASVRRTSTFEVTPDPGWDAGVQVRAGARDRHVGADGAAEVLDVARIEVGIDEASVITALKADPSASNLEVLVGGSVSRGFRRRLDEVAESGAEGGFGIGSLTAALLDDLPTVRMVTGYARMMEIPGQLTSGQSPLLGVCAGWHPEGTAAARTVAAVPLLNSPPTAPALETLIQDPDDFPAEAPLRPSSMRRRRILELARSETADDEIEVFEYFRDSHVDPAGREGALHEYVVELTVGAADLVVRRIHVQPRALPFPECPLASPNAAALIGTSLGGVVGTVRTELAGTRGCTHLNDVLRFLRFVPALAEQL